LAGGLARIESNRFVDGRVGRAVSDPSETGLNAILADEVRAVQFRYFDGGDWRDAWDSDAAGRLPRAVEVVLLLRPLKSRAIDSRDDRPRDEQRAVIWVPLSEPYATGKEP
jgi:hypothetical protein